MNNFLRMIIFITVVSTISIGVIGCSSGSEQADSGETSTTSETQASIQQPRYEASILALLKTSNLTATYDNLALNRISGCMSENTYDSISYDGALLVTSGISYSEFASILKEENIAETDPTVLSEMQESYEVYCNPRNTMTCVEHMQTYL